ncbi:hypothetical protein GCM10027398_41030 [Azotobacter salinestris]
MEQIKRRPLAFGQTAPGYCKWQQKSYLLWNFPELARAAEQQGNHEKNQEKYEEYFGDAGSSPRDATEAEQPSNDGDDKKYDGPSQHVMLLRLRV